MHFHSMLCFCFIYFTRAPEIKKKITPELNEITTWTLDSLGRYRAG